MMVDLNAVLFSARSAKDYLQFGIFTSGFCISINQ